MKKNKIWQRVCTSALAMIMAFPAMGINAQAMKASGETDITGKMVIVTASDVETVTNSFAQNMESVKSVYDQNKTGKNLKLDKFTQNPEKIVVEEGPAGYPYKFVGFGDYVHKNLSRFYVFFEKDENGNALKDEDGNYVIKDITRKTHNSTGIITWKDLLVNGEVCEDPTAYFDGMAGEDGVQFLLKDSQGNMAYTYCVSMGVSVDEEAWYSVGNLSDGDYYPSVETEDKVRAIALHGYWGAANIKDTNGEYPLGSLERVKADVKKAIQEGKVEDTYNIRYRIYSDSKNYTVESIDITVTEAMIDKYLTESVALEMTQNAIWTWSNGSWERLMGKDGFIVAEPIYSDRTNPELSAVSKLGYEYLVNIEPQKEKTVVIDERNFIDDLKVVVSEDGNTEDNIYNATLKFTLAAEPSVKDDLVLKIKYADEIIAVRLAGMNDEGENYVTLTPENGVYTISGLSMEENVPFDITMQMVGEQYLAQDAYMYIPEEGFDASQAMIGIAEGTRTVDVSMSAEVCFDLEDYKERKINFYKTTIINEQRIPLQGIEFDIHKVCSLEEYTANNNKYVETRELSNGIKKDFVSSQVLNNLKDYPLVETVVTDKNGRAVYDLTADGQPDGIYLVIEKDHPAITAPLPPFYVTVPQTSDDGTDTEYIIDLEPKNALLPGPQIDKDVTEIDQEEDTVNAGEEFTWIIRTTIPADIAKAKEYVISDELDYRLTYADDLVVKVEDKEEKADNSVSSGDVLVADKDYTLDVAGDTVTVNGAEEEIQKFTVTLTPDGMKKVAKFAGADRSDREIRVYFNTFIDEDASMGEEIENEAKLNYTNSVGMNYKVDSDEPVVYTCGINIKKYDAKDTKKFLDGAEFMLARKATQAELEDDTVETSTLVIGRGQTEEVVYVDFYNNAKLIGPKVQSVLTDKDGDAMIYGIKELFETDADGNLVKDDEGNPVTAKYYLVETKAPEGYNLLSYPVEVIVNRDSHVTEDDLTTPDVNEDMTVRVANSNRFELPSTGGIGTTIFTLVGAALTLGSGAVLAGKKRKEEEE